MRLMNVAVSVAEYLIDFDKIRLFKGVAHPLHEDKILGSISLTNSAMWSVR